MRSFRISTSVVARLFFACFALVVLSAPAAFAQVPWNATASADLDASGSWKWEHDGGTPGWSNASSFYPVNLSYSDVRELTMTYGNHGGERWHLSWGKDGSATHFALDTYIYVTNPDQLANLELDINQVMNNGETLILGTQCSSYSHTWEWTYQSSGHPHWHASNIYCNPRAWAANTWHHIQIGMHRDSSGNVTHDWVNLDGNHATFSGAYGNSGLWLGWGAGNLSANVQMDGAYSGGGSIKAYIHKMTIYRW